MDKEVKTFINHSNHPSENWSSKQMDAALAYGQVEDLPFPNIPAGCSDETIDSLVEENLKQILSRNPAAVMCQGEFVYSFRLITRLKELGITVLAATSERKVIEVVRDGKSYKESEYEFYGFRIF